MRKFGIKVILLVGLTQLISVNVWAEQPDCNMVADRASSQATAQMPVFLPIAREKNGQVKYMTHDQATQYCADLKAHLPSAREWAQLAVSFGSKGIVDKCDVEGICFPVNATNVDGTSDSFYFSFSGYERPDGDLGNNWFWSSSVNTCDPDQDIVDNGSVTITFDRRLEGYGGNAVRCVLN